MFLNSDRAKKTNNPTTHDKPENAPMATRIAPMILFAKKYSGFKCDTKKDKTIRNRHVLINTFMILSFRIIRLD